MPGMPSRCSRRLFRSPLLLLQGSAPNSSRQPLRPLPEPVAEAAQDAETAAAPEPPAAAEPHTEDTAAAVPQPEAPQVPTPEPGPASEPAAGPAAPPEPEPEPAAPPPTAPPAPRAAPSGEVDPDELDKLIEAESRMVRGDACLLS